MTLALRVTRTGWHATYQVDDTSWVGLLGGLLGEEEETFAGVGSPGGVLVGSLGLLATEVACEVLGVDGLGPEEEELLLEDEAPAKWMLVILIPRMTT